MATRMRLASPFPPVLPFNTASSVIVAACRLAGGDATMIAVRQPMFSLRHSTAHMGRAHQWTWLRKGTVAHRHCPGGTRSGVIGGLMALGFGWWPVLARHWPACFFYGCQAWLELVCLGVRLGYVGNLVCLVGAHLVEHETRFPVGSVIRKAVNWLRPQVQRRWMISRVSMSRTIAPVRFSVKETSPRAARKGAHDPRHPVLVEAAESLSRAGYGANDFCQPTRTRQSVSSCGPSRS